MALAAIVSLFHAGPMRARLAPQHRPHQRINLGCVVDFENAELKFVRCSRAVAGVNCTVVY